MTEAAQIVADLIRALRFGCHLAGRGLMLLLAGTDASTPGNGPAALTSSTGLKAGDSQDRSAMTGDLLTG